MEAMSDEAPETVEAAAGAGAGTKTSLTPALPEEGGSATEFGLGDTADDGGRAAYTPIIKEVNTRYTTIRNSTKVCVRNFRQPE